ncbi:pentapeptide repeat-containing protein [Flavobacterium silvaticum]|uniref:Pentapeptide repeat-containing protein n=1 Tax=Flavobacterium silvaticum TaxID=1852020 RepID=A0A972FQD8_9FLAO|nr:pentapeptide repeat-containing protein [Flavobacterium silvaticum]NMH29440.1 pentapeptide repeat-containing protein [Flavobacterium silvaticum]
MKVFTDREFGPADSEIQSWQKASLDQCVLRNCDFATLDLTGSEFENCEFISCNFSNAKCRGTAFRDCSFSESKLLGFRFDLCDAFGLQVSFDSCQLDHASFYKCRLPKTKFLNSRLIQTDLSEADFFGSDFSGSDMNQAVFDRTNLEQCDFRSASGYTIDPTNNKLKKAKFSQSGIAGLLSQFQISIEP